MRIGTISSSLFKLTYSPEQFAAEKQRVSDLLRAAASSAIVNVHIEPFLGLFGVKTHSRKVIDGLISEVEQLTA